MDDGPTPDVPAFKAKVRALLHSIGAIEVDIHLGSDVAELFFWLDGTYHWTKPLYVLGAGGPQVDRIAREVETFVAEQKQAHPERFPAATWQAWARQVTPAR